VKAQHYYNDKEETSQNIIINKTDYDPIVQRIYKGMVMPQCVFILLY
jgi:hypothetical protein